MKFKYIGPQDEVTLRGVTFAKGKAVDLPEDSLLADKISRLDEFALVKTRARKNDKNEQ